TGNEMAVQGDSIKVNLSVNNWLGANITLTKISLDALDTTFAKALERNRNINFSQSLYIFTTKPVTQPYWLEQKMSEGSFNVDDQLLIGKPQNGPAYQAHFTMTIEGQ